MVTGKIGTVSGMRSWSLWRDDAVYPGMKQWLGTGSIDGSGWVYNAERRYKYYTREDAMKSKRYYQHNSTTTIHVKRERVTAKG